MPRARATSGRPGLFDLIRWMSPQRKWQLVLLCGLTMAGVVAELLTIGAVLPFLHLVVAPAAAAAGSPPAAWRRLFGGWSAADLVAAAALLLAGCAIAAAGLRLLLTWAGQRFIHRLGYDMDVALFRRAVGQPYLRHVERHGSEMLSGFDKVNMLANNLVLPAILGAASALTAAFIVALLVWIDPVTATATTVAVGAIYLSITLTVRHSLHRVSEQRARLGGKRIKAVQEGLGGLRDIVLDRSRAVHERHFAAIDDAFRDAGARAALVAALPRYVVEGTGVALIGLVAVHLAGRPGGVLAAVPVLGTLVLGAQRLLPLLQSSYQGYVQYLTVRHSLADVLDLLAEPVDEVAAPRPGVAPPFAREIALAGVGFRYPGAGAAALAAVDLRIARGQRIGLIGTTGSGKSTLVDVLVGLLPPTEGAILLDGVPLAPDRVAAWQAQVAHVPQTVFLADDSIAANIAFAADSGGADMARVEVAAQRAQLHDVVAALPQGYATTVGERGVRLSGGQRQRVGIARALYRRCDLLILDEATSALDGTTAAAVMASVAALGRDVTTVVIAHRLSTLRDCDVIYRLEGGRIVAQGDYRTMTGDREVAA